MKVLFKREGGEGFLQSQVDPTMIVVSNMLFLGSSDGIMMLNNTYGLFQLLQNQAILSEINSLSKILLSPLTKSIF